MARWKKVREWSIADAYAGTGSTFSPYLKSVFRLSDSYTILTTDRRYAGTQKPHCALISHAAGAGAGSISAWVPVDTVSAHTGGRIIGVCPLSATTFLVAYWESDSTIPTGGSSNTILLSAFAVVGSIAGGSISFGTPVDITPDNGLRNDVYGHGWVARLTDTHAIVTFPDQVHYVYVTTAGSAVTASKWQQWGVYTAQYDFDTSLQGWSAFGGATVTWDSTHQLMMGGCVKVTYAGTGSGVVSPKIPVPAGVKDYLWWFAVRDGSATPSDWTNFEIRFYDSSLAELTAYRASRRWETVIGWYSNFNWVDSFPSDAVYIEFRWKYNSDRTVEYVDDFILRCNQQPPSGIGEIQAVRGYGIIDHVQLADNKLLLIYGVEADFLEPYYAMVVTFDSAGKASYGSALSLSSDSSETAMVWGGNGFEYDFRGCVARPLSNGNVLLMMLYSYQEGEILAVSGTTVSKVTGTPSANRAEVSILTADWIVTADQSVNDKLFDASGLLAGVIPLTYAPRRSDSWGWAGDAAAKEWLDRVVTGGYSTTSNFRRGALYDGSTFPMMWPTNGNRWLAVRAAIIGSGGEERLDIMEVEVETETVAWTHTVDPAVQLNANAKLVLRGVVPTLTPVKHHRR